MKSMTVGKVEIARLRTGILVCWVPVSYISDMVFRRAPNEPRMINLTYENMRNKELRINPEKRPEVYAAVAAFLCLEHGGYLTDE